MTQEAKGRRRASLSMLSVKPSRFLGNGNKTFNEDFAVDVVKPSDNNEFDSRPSLTSTTGSGSSKTFEDENSDLRRQFSNALDVISQQRQEVQSLRTEVEELRKSSKELASENDELVNDMHDLLRENEELQSRLESADEQDSSLHARFDHLIRERDQLAERLEDSQENSIQAEQVTEVVQQIRSQMKYKLQEAANQQSGLENRVKELCWQRDELNQTLNTMASEKNELSKRMEQMVDIVQDLQNGSGMARLQKAEERVNDLTWQRDELNLALNTMATEKNEMSKKIEELMSELHVSRRKEASLIEENRELHHRLGARQDRREERRSSERHRSSNTRQSEGSSSPTANTWRSGGSSNASKSTASIGARNFLSKEKLKPRWKLGQQGSRERPGSAGPDDRPDEGLGVEGSSKRTQRRMSAPGYGAPPTEKHGATHSRAPSVVGAFFNFMENSVAKPEQHTNNGSTNPYDEDDDDEEIDARCLAAAQSFGLDAPLNGEQFIDNDNTTNDAHHKHTDQGSSSGVHRSSVRRSSGGRRHSNKSKSRSKATQRSSGSHQNSAYGLPNPSTKSKRTGRRRSTPASSQAIVDFADFANMQDDGPGWSATFC